MNDYHGVIGPRDDKPSMQEAAALIGAPRFAAAAWIGEAPQTMLRNHSVVSVVPDEGGFDADVAIATGELVKLIPDVIEALGGEVEGQ